MELQLLTMLYGNALPEIGCISVLDWTLAS